MGFKVAKTWPVQALTLLLPSIGWAGFETGVGLDINRDLYDSGTSLSPTSMGTGVLLRSPNRWWFRDRFALRADATLGASWGQDRVEWRAYQATVPVYSEDHGTTLTTAGVMLGPEISPWASESASPYFGAQLGMIWARHWHRFDEDDARLMGLASATDGLHPYTTQTTPAVDLHGGVRFELPGRLAMEVEAGYNVAFMRQARLAQAPKALEAIRTAYGLNQMRLGVSLVIPLVTGTES